jgi:O-antigen ligase
MASNWLAILIVVCAVIGVAARDRARDWKETGLSPFALLLALVWVWATLSAFWAPDATRALIKASALAVLFLSALLLAGRAYDPAAIERDKIGRVLSLGFVFIVVFALDDHFGHPLKEGLWRLLSLERKWRLAGMNRALDILAISVWPAFLLLWTAGHKKPALAGCLAAALTIFAGVPMIAKVALVLGGLSLGLVLIFGPVIVRLAAFGLAGVSVTMPLLARYVLRPETHGWLGDVRLSALHRLHIWQFVTDRIAEKPLLGFGLDSSRTIPGGEALVGPAERLLPLHPHNAALQMWLELGLPGALLFSALLFLTAWRIAGAAISRLAKAVALATLASAFAVLHAAFGIWQSWWLGALGLIAALTIFAVSRENTQSGILAAKPGPL